MANSNDRIHQLIQEEQLSNVEFAKRIGINKSTVTRYLSGDISPNIDVLISISKEFRVSLDWLVGISDSKDFSQTDRLISYHQAFKAIINRCEKENINPEKLNKMIDVLKD